MSLNGVRDDRGAGKSFQQGIKLTAPGRLWGVVCWRRTTLKADIPVRLAQGGLLEPRHRGGSNEQVLKDSPVAS